MPLLRLFVSTISKAYRSVTMGSQPPSPAFDVHKVAIIGAGPSGLAAAKYLRAQDAITQIDIFEKQPQVGGIWNYSQVVSKNCPVPQEDPFYPPDPPVRVEGKEQPIFPSALYDRLCANITGRLMGFSDFGFPENALLFPARETILEVLEGYAEDVRDRIKFSMEVKKVTRREDGEGRDKWFLEAERADGVGRHEEVYDAVVVANGHYSVPHIPDIKGMKEFDAKNPGVISHAKQYRTPDIYKDKNVVVVGNGPSGVDVALQVNTVSRGTTLLSVRSPTSKLLLELTGCEEVPEIAEFLPEQRGVRLTDGRTETDIDAIVFCTGYMFSYPFLPTLQPPLITDGHGVHGLYKHFLHITHPTLTFPCLNYKVVPWPVAEAQASVFAALWANQLDLPPKEIMEQWSQELEKKNGGSVLHVLEKYEDGYFLNELYEWAQKARKPGKEGPYWGDEMFWIRSIFAEAKVRFEVGGRKARKLEEVGFVYEEGAGERALAAAREAAKGKA